MEIGIVAARRAIMIPEETFVVLRSTGNQNIAPFWQSFLQRISRQIVKSFGEVSGLPDVTFFHWKFSAL